MEAKEILARLEIVKLATTIGEHDTIEIQANHLIAANSSRLNEICTLLNSKNYRQALYLIKGYISDMGETERFNNIDFSDDSEKVLDIEDMLRMSPLAKETIRDYKRSAYTNDDLEAFAKNIEVSPTVEYNNMVNNYIPQEPKEIQKELKQNNYVDNVEKEIKKNQKIKEEIRSGIEETQESKDIATAVENADKETPLDEISAEVLGDKTRKSRSKVLSKYKTLRAKFSKKSLSKEDGLNKQIQESKETIRAEDNNLKQKNIESNKLEVNTTLKDSITENKIEENIESKLSKEEKEISEKKDLETIYSPVPYIEEKFRQAFILYPPLKESEVWVEEVIKFLKYVAKNSFTERDVKSFLDEYDYYLEKKDIARASQVLLLASATESEYAQFILARELFAGKVLNRDLKKSFTVMKYLANKFYPEAVCDLGQFYEYGIGVPKDKKVAIRLYEKAFELGVSRATKHINRLKESSGLLSTIFKLK